MELQCESTLGGEGRRYTGQIWTQGSVFWKGATLRSRLTCSLIMRADLGLYHALSLIVAPPANWWHSDPSIALSQPKGPGARPHGVQMAWRKVRLPRVMSVCVCVCCTSLKRGGKGQKVWSASHCCRNVIQTILSDTLTCSVFDVFYSLNIH